MAESGSRSSSAVHPVMPRAGVGSEAILVAGPDGAVQAAYGWEGLTGQPASETLGDGWLLALDPSAQSDVRQHLGEVLQHRQACCGEGRLREPSRGEMVRWCVRTVPGEGNGTGAAGIVLSFVGVLGVERRPGLFSMFDPITDGTERAWLRACVRHAVLRLRQDEDDDALVALLHVQIIPRTGEGSVTDLGVAGIAAVAGRFRSVLKPLDVLAAAGGADFLVLCEDLSLRSEGGAIGARLARTLRAPLIVGDRTRRVGAAVGVAVTDDAAATADLLVHRAGQAMERAKRRGLGPVSSFTRRARADAAMSGI